MIMLQHTRRDRTMAIAPDTINGCFHRLSQNLTPRGVTEVYTLATLVDGEIRVHDIAFRASRLYSPTSSDEALPHLNALARAVLASSLPDESLAQGWSGQLEINIPARVTRVLALGQPSRRAA